MKRLFCFVVSAVCVLAASAVTSLEDKLNATEAGRALLHGTAQTVSTQIIDTNSLTQVTTSITTYADGYGVTNSVTNALSRMSVYKLVHGGVVARAYDATNHVVLISYADGVSVSNIFEASSAVPRRVAEIRAMRAAAGWTTNMITMVVSPGSGPVPSRAPRSFSVLKLKRAIESAGYWPQAKAYMESNGLWDDFVIAQVIKEDDPAFTNGLNSVKGLLKLSDAQVESVLSSCLSD